MNAKELIGVLDLNPDDFLSEDFTVKGISIDSRQVGSDYCFIALRGNSANGHDFIPQAIENGARLIIYEQGQSLKSSFAKDKENVIFIPVSQPRRDLSKLAARFYGKPAEKLKLIGITGTNGKTTVSFLIENMLQYNQSNPAVIGTIHYKIADHIIPAKNTTPDAIKIQHLFLHMVEHSVTHAIMEVSSHALDQLRTQGLNFRIGVFTNLTHDHLDYHKDMETYFLAKAQLFINLTSNDCAVINADDECGLRLINMTKAKILDYGINNHNAKVRAQDLKLGLEESSFTVITPWGKIKLVTKFIGRHNIYNILACICVGLQEDISLECIKSAIEVMALVPGRLERVQHKQPFEVFIDYAHTDDALKNVLSCLRQLQPRRIITVFGCGGDRDKKKRPLMGKVATMMSDFLIITNDNPRTEQPEKIVEDILSGFNPEFGNYKVVLDRKQAIEQAMALAKEGDFILVAGKGHETCQIFADKIVDFDDRKIVTQILGC